MRKITEIIIHCSATPEGRDYTVQDIDRWHRERGFKGIGYHFVIYRDGSIHAGRSKDQIGAHCTGHNSCSIGVCYIGGLGKDTRTPQQKDSMLQLLKQLKREFPNAKIYGHKDFAPKDCPCFDATAEYSSL